MAETKEARKKRLERNKRNMMTVKADQVGVCRFVSVTVQDFEVDGNGKYSRCGSHIENGLQYENFIVLPDGSYKYLNSSSVRITKIYERAPEWANEYLRNLEMANFLFDMPIKVGQNGVLDISNNCGKGSIGTNMNLIRVRNDREVKKRHPRRCDCKICIHAIINGECVKCNISGEVAVNKMYCNHFKTAEELVR